MVETDNQREKALKKALQFFIPNKNVQTIEELIEEQFDASIEASRKPVQKPENQPKIKMLRLDVAGLEGYLRGKNQLFLKNDYDPNNSNHARALLKANIVENASAYIGQIDVDINSNTCGYLKVHVDNDFTEIVSKAYESFDGIVDKEKNIFIRLEKGSEDIVKGITTAKAISVVYAMDIWNSDNTRTKKVNVEYLFNNNTEELLNNLTFDSNITMLEGLKKNPSYRKTEEYSELRQFEGLLKLKQVLNYVIPQITSNMRHPGTRNPDKFESAPNLSDHVQMSSLDEKIDEPENHDFMTEPKEDLNDVALPLKKNVENDYSKVDYASSMLNNPQKIINKIEDLQKDYEKKEYSLLKRVAATAAILTASAIGIVAYGISQFYRQENQVIQLPEPTEEMEFAEERYSDDREPMCMADDVPKVSQPVIAETIPQEDILAGQSSGAILPQGMLNENDLSDIISYDKVAWAKQSEGKEPYFMLRKGKLTQQNVELVIDANNEQSSSNLVGVVNVDGKLYKASLDDKGAGKVIVPNGKLNYAGVINEIKVGDATIGVYHSSEKFNKPLSEIASLDEKVENAKTVTSFQATNEMYGVTDMQTQVESYLDAFGSSKNAIKALEYMNNAESDIAKKAIFYMSGTTKDTWKKGDRVKLVNDLALNSLSKTDLEKVMDYANSVGIQKDLIKAEMNEIHQTIDKEGSISPDDFRLYDELVSRRIQSGDLAPKTAILMTQIAERYVK